MKIIVFANELGLGGSQLKAIELGAADRDLGHAVVDFSEPGVLLERIEALSLELVAAPEADVRPSPTMIRALRSIVQERGIDVVHGYEWPSALRTRRGVLYRRCAPRIRARPLDRGPGPPHDLGGFALRKIRERFLLEAAARAQVSCYEHAREAGGRVGPSEVLRAIAIYGLHALHRKSARLRGDGPRDDFNAIAGANPGSRSPGLHASHGTPLTTERNSP